MMCVYSDVSNNHHININSKAKLEQMDKVFTLILTFFLISSTSLISQNEQTIINSLTIEGFSQEIIHPISYKVQIHLREIVERTIRGYMPKDSLEDIDIRLKTDLMKLGYDIKELEIHSFTSDAIDSGKNRRYFEGKIYELILTNKADVISLYNNLNFEGLRGLNVINVFPDLKEFEIRLYQNALKDARDKATIILSKMGYKIQNTSKITVDLQPEKWIRWYPFSASFYFSVNNPKFKFENYPTLMRCITKVTFTYK